MTTISRGLLDTSVIIALGELDYRDLPQSCLISAVTLAELSAGPLVAADPHERAARQARLQQVERDFNPLPFDADCARAFGQVSADLRASGRKSKARAYDAMIAATAIAHNLPLFTLNPADFTHITQLELHPLAIPTSAFPEVEALQVDPVLQQSRQEILMSVCGISKSPSLASGEAVSHLLAGKENQTADMAQHNTETEAALAEGKDILAGHVPVKTFATAREAIKDALNESPEISSSVGCHLIAKTHDPVIG